MWWQWASIAAALALDKTQREQLIQLRRMYLRVLGKAVRQRRQQLQLLHVSACAPANGPHDCLRRVDVQYADLR